MMQDSNNLPPAACGGGSEFSALIGDGGGKLRGGGGSPLTSVAIRHSGEKGKIVWIPAFAGMTGARAHSTPPEHSPPTASSGNAPTPPRKRRGV